MSRLVPVIGAAGNKMEIPLPVRSKKINRKTKWCFLGDFGAGASTKLINAQIYYHIRRLSESGAHAILLAHLDAWL